MNPVIYNLKNKLTWMASRLRWMNDDREILGWIEAMEAVHALLQKSLKNTEVWKLTKPWQRTCRLEQGEKIQMYTCFSPTEQKEKNEPRLLKKQMVSEQRSKARVVDASWKTQKSRSRDETMEMEVEELNGIKRSIVIEGDEEVASGVVALKGESTKKVTNPTQEESLKEEKKVWRTRLRKAFCARIKKKIHPQSSRQYWFNTREKFNGLLKEVAKENNIDLQRGSPKDKLLQTRIWSYLFMEVDRWANDLFFSANELL